MCTMAATRGTCGQPGLSVSKPIFCFHKFFLTLNCINESHRITQYTIATRMAIAVIANQGMRNCCLFFTAPSISVMLANSSIETLNRTRIRFKLIFSRLER